MIAQWQPLHQFCVTAHENGSANRPVGRYNTLGEYIEYMGKQQQKIRTIAPNSQKTSRWIILIQNVNLLKGVSNKF